MFLKTQDLHGLRARNWFIHMKMQEIVVHPTGRSRRGQDVTENAALIGIMGFSARAACGPLEFDGAPPPNHDGVDPEAGR
jgi:hypothetical protein